MNSLFRWRVAVLTAAVLAAAGAARAQQKPHIGYVYPAGGRQGSVLEVTVGGQYLSGVADVYISGKGVRAKVIKHTRPLSRKQLNDLSKKLRELGKLRGRKAVGGKKGAKAGLQMIKAAEDFRVFASKLGLEDPSPMGVAKLRKKLVDPKRQPNPQIAEIVTLKITVAGHAEPGQRELRLKTSLGVTNPIFLNVGQCREYMEKEPNDRAPDGKVLEGEMTDVGITTLASLPVVINGQIMPGDVDRFRFPARKGMRLVAAVSARKLMPYLADAVPGWFQATLKLSDADGNEVAYTDDFRFHPDPVIYYEVPKSGDYILEIKDSIFRGREDFVYRITLGEVPFVTSVFPLGGRAGAKTTVQLKGWNLPTEALTLDTKGKGPGILPVSVSKDERVSNRVPFALDTLPECLETESNNAPSGAQLVKLPTIVNGRIDRPGDRDVFRFKGRAGDRIVAEIHARRLGSPLDSLLKLTDAKGKQLAVNDDYEDKGAGLTTHHADSRLIAKLPADGTYFLHLGDTQNKGGGAYGYRLRISPCRPDFALRVVPSSINARAGQTLPITVYALRKDGFSGQIELKLKDMRRGFILGGGWIPPGEDKVRLTLTVPRIPLEKPVNLFLEGIATVGAREIRHTAVPAEDMMQAFFYRHLVPTKDWMVSVGGRRRYAPPLKVLSKGPVMLPAGGTARVRLAAPKGPFMQQVQMELSDPPKGIAIKKISRSQEGVAILLSAEAGKVKPGLRGNLIVKAFTMRAPKSKDGKPRPKRRVSLGTLPAIPFEIAAVRPPKSPKP